MEDEAVDDLPLLEEADVPVLLDERVIADEESRRDSRDTPLRQTPVIQSIHCGCYLGQDIHVKQVARKVWNAVLDPKRSQHGVLVALRHPRVSVCVFPSGKVISMGAKSEASALLGCRKVARMVQRLPGYEAVRVSDFRVHNVTASGALGYRIDLRALARHPLHEEHVEYNPDQFPGLHYKLQDARPTASHTAAAATAHSAQVKAEQPPVASLVSIPPASSAATGPSSLTVTLYFSGRFTLVGAQHELDVYRHFDYISRALFPFSSLHSRQQPQQTELGAADSKQALQLSYELWLEAATREERAKAGRMGWEEEADRVRLELAKRERKRATVGQSSSAVRQQQQHVGMGAEVRVKPEPGTAAAADGAAMHDETKEADPVPAAPVGPFVDVLAAGLSTDANMAASDAASGQQGMDERKDNQEKDVDGPSDGSTTSDSAVIVAVSHAGEELGDEDVEWE